MTLVSNYWETVHPTFMENWPQELHDMSIRSTSLPLSLAQAEALGTNIEDYFETWEQPWGRDISQVRNALGSAIHNIGGAAFVRLGSRSPKDSWGWFKRGPRVTTGSEALRLLLSGSERINDDLHLCVANDYRPHLWVREWVDIKPENEFRCFIYGGELIGISQYVYSDHSQEHDAVYPWIVENADRIEKLIRYWAEQHFIPACHLHSVIADVGVFDEQTLVGRWDGDTLVALDPMWSALLIEINPFFTLTDPCLFDWSKAGMFDGRFIYKEGP